MKKILLVDDDKAMGLLLKAVLGKNFDLFHVENGLKALLWLEQGNEVDLIISDVQMPIMDGYEFITKLRSSGFYHRTPLIMLSGMDTSADRIKCYELGADDYMVKPFNPKELELKVGRLMSFAER
jgi:two-component system, chemotaxis family, chemotaxis protein CheY